MLLQGPHRSLGSKFELVNGQGESLYITRQKKHNDYEKVFLCFLYFVAHTAMPHGPSPALIVVITLFVLVSMTVTSFDRPLAV